jgi:hypothetical protein
VLTDSDGTNTDSLTFVGFTGNASNLDFSENASDTGTLITDPQSDSSSDPSGTHGPSIPSDQFTNFIGRVHRRMPHFGYRSSINLSRLYCDSLEDITV